MNLKEYMSAKKLIEQSNKNVEIKIQKRGYGKRVGEQKSKQHKRRTAKRTANRKS